MGLQDIDGYMHRGAATASLRECMFLFSRPRLHGGQRDGVHDVLHRAAAGQVVARPGQALQLF